MTNGGGQIAGKQKGAPDGAPSVRSKDLDLGQADHGGGGCGDAAQHQQEDGGETIEKPFEAGKRHERHDTHLSVGNLRGSGGVLI